MTHSSSDSHARAALASRILKALGIAAAALSIGACGGNVVVDSGKGAGGDEGGGGAAGTTTTSGTGGVTTSTVPPSCDQAPTGQYLDACVNFGASCPSLADAEQKLFDAVIQTGSDCSGADKCCVLNPGGCGPYVQSDGSCCYLLDVSVYTCVEGRPFVANGEARTAEAARRDDWLADTALPETASLDARTREVLAARFREGALFEHASVASFARFTLELLRLGAPADLVAASQRAAADEVRHAQISFALASAYAGEPVGPSALDLAGAPPLGRPAAEIAAAVAFEGCLNETVAALIAAAERDRATDPAVRATLSSIAADEASHAELAWRALGWMLSNGGRDVAEAARGVLLNPHLLSPEEGSNRDDAPESAGRSNDVEGASPAALSAHGWLSAREKRAVAEATLREVVLPCARALLASGPAEANARGAAAAAALPFGA